MSKEKPKIKVAENTAKQVETSKKDILYKQIGELQVEIEKISVVLQKLNQRKIQLMQELEKAKQCKS